MNCTSPTHAAAFRAFSNYKIPITPMRRLFQTQYPQSFLMKNGNYRKIIMAIGLNDTHAPQNSTHNKIKLNLWFAEQDERMAPSKALQRMLDEYE